MGLGHMSNAENAAGVQLSSSVGAELRVSPVQPHPLIFGSRDTEPASNGVFHPQVKSRHGCFDKVGACPTTANAPHLRPRSRASPVFHSCPLISVPTFGAC